MTRTFGLCVLAIASCPLALAADGEGEKGGGGADGGAAYARGAGTPWYSGINAGQSRAKIDDSRIVAGMLGAGFNTSSINDNDRDGGYKIYGGYRINRNFAIEGGYFDLGRFGFNATTAAPNAGTLNGSIRLQGLNIDAVGTIPIRNRFSAFARVGLAYAEARDTFSGTGAVNVINPNPRKSEVNYKIGAGLQYDFNPAFGLRLEAERYRINDAVGNKSDIDLISVGLIYRFSAK